MDRITIENGMQDISSGTCIKFVPRTHEANFLDIQPRYGWVWLLHEAFFFFYISWNCLWWWCMSFLCCAWSCWSFLGQTGGSQTLSLQTPGCMWSGVAAHEFMHALGFVHEQSRSDRDHYVSIVWKNIIPGLDHLLILYCIQKAFSLPHLRYLLCFDRPNAQLQETGDKQSEQSIWLQLCHALWKVSCSLKQHNYSFCMCCCGCTIPYTLCIVPPDMPSLKTADQQ